MNIIIDYLKKSGSRIEIIYSVLFLLICIPYSLFFQYSPDEIIIVPFSIAIGFTIPAIMYFGKKMVVLPFLHSFTVSVIVSQNQTMILIGFVLSLVLALLHLLLANVVIWWVKWVKLDKKIDFTPIQFLILNAILLLILFVYAAFLLGFYVIFSSDSLEIFDIFIFTFGILFGLICINGPMITILNKMESISPLLKGEYQKLEDQMANRTYYAAFTIYSVIICLFLIISPNKIIVFGFGYIPIVIFSLVWGIVSTTQIVFIFNMTMVLSYTILQPNMTDGEILTLQLTVIVSTLLIYMMGINTSNIKLEQQKRKESEAQLLYMQKNQVISRFAGGLAHKVNNINQVILGYLELLRLIINETNSGNRDMELEHLSVIENKLNSTRSLMKNMLQISKKQHGEKRLDSFDEVLNNLLKVFGTLAGDNITIKTNIEAVPLFTFDRSQIQQVVLNLVKNSIDAIGGNKGSIVISLTKTYFDKEEELQFGKLEKGDYIVMTIMDDGIGIPQEHFDKIFEPFYTTKESGTGLGLSVVQGLVDSNNGVLDIYSRPGEKTEVNIYFKYDADSLSESILTKTSRPKTRKLPDSIQSVIIIDDEQSLTEVLTSIFELEDIKTKTFNNPVEFLELLDNENHIISDCDLIISDISMPGLIGTEMVKILRQKGIYTPVLLISGYAEKIQEIDKFDNKVKFLEKPFSISKLFQTTNELIQ